METINNVFTSLFSVFFLHKRTQLSAGANSIQQYSKEDYSTKHDFLCITFNADQVHAGLEVLVQCNWVRVEHQDTGGRPTGIVSIHPALMGSAA